MYFLSFLFLVLEFYSVILSVFFELLDLWAKRKDINMNSKVYVSKKFLDFLKLFRLMIFLPKRTSEFFFLCFGFILLFFHYSDFFFCDCGVFVVAFVEYLLHGLEILDDINIDQMKSQYTMSLYIYCMMKQRDAVESEYEYQKMLNRNEKG